MLTLEAPHLLAPSSLVEVWVILRMNACVTRDRANNRHEDYTLEGVEGADIFND